MTKPGIMIGIPTYNGAHRVEMLLTNLKQRTPLDQPFEIVVCDDSGKPHHRDRVRNICAAHGATFVCNLKNKGVAGSWNTLVRATDHEMAVLLNDDVLVAKDWLNYLTYAVRENPAVGSFSMNCRFITADDAKEIVKGPDSKVIPLNVYWKGTHLVRDERFKVMPLEEDNHCGRVMCPAGCFFGFRRETYEKVGGFDERYRAFYEETDFGVSLAHRGMPTFTLPVPADNYHIWSATFASAPEVPAGQIMKDSKAKFVEKWSKILGIKFNDAPDIHHLLMDKIPLMKVRWLGIGKKPREENL